MMTNHCKFTKISAHFLKPEFFKADFVKIMTWHLYFVPLLVRRETRGSFDLTKAAIGQVERLTRDDDVEKRAVSKSEHWKFFCKISTLDKWFTERVFHRDTYWHWNWNLCWSKLGYFGEFPILEKGRNLQNKMYRSTTTSTSIRSAS